jgi:hypothetical protein
MNRTNVAVYPLGVMSPIRTITDGIAGGYDPYPGSGSQMTFDRSSNLYVANQQGGVTVYAPGGTSPIRTITQGIQAATT